MYLTIFQKIIHNHLHSQQMQTPVIYLGISHLLDNVPETLPEIENRLNQVLDENLKVNFNDGMPVNISRLLTNPVFTPIVVDYFPPEMELLSPPATTPSERYYYFLISAEARRIKLRLLQCVEILKDDCCAKEEIKEVLNLLSLFAESIRNLPQPNPVFDFLLTNIVKLYFELTFMFEALLSEKDYISFFDFYAFILNRQADNDEKKAYQKTLRLHQAQRFFNKWKDNAAVLKLLALLYANLAISPTDNRLITVTCALENAVLLQAENTGIPSFCEIVDESFVKALLKDKKQAINNRLNTLSNAREALNEIEDAADNLPCFPPATPGVNDSLASSVVRKLIAWLAEQKDIYKTNAAQIFIPTVQIETAKVVGAIPPRQKINPEKQKNMALKRLAFLSGYNRMNEKIMSDNDFAQLASCICALIDTGSAPENIKPIAQTSISNEYLRYTFYLIHKDLYTTRPIRPEWIDLLHAVFTQFKDVEKETTRKKFATAPLHYDSDIKSQPPLSSPKLG